MKGLFIPEITAEMFRNGCLESIETLMAEGEIYDIDYSLEQESCEDCISREAVLDMVEDMTDQFGVGHRVVTEGMISLLPPVTPKPKTDVLDKIRAEIDSAKMPKNRMSFFRDGIDTALEIIDKYKVRK